MEVGVRTLALRSTDTAIHPTCRTLYYLVVGVSLISNLAYQHIWTGDKMDDPTQVTYCGPPCNCRCCSIATPTDSSALPHDIHSCNLLATGSCPRWVPSSSCSSFSILPHWYYLTSDNCCDHTILHILLAKSVCYGGNSLYTIPCLVLLLSQVGNLIIGLVDMRRNGHCAPSG